MPRIAYIGHRFNSAARQMIDAANVIIAEYAGQGFNLTLRQLYYQFVARGLLENTLLAYKRLGGVINDARMAGEVDWDAIIDRTRNLASLPSWASPVEIVHGCASQFRLDKWNNQKHRVEVWIEKEALVGVFEGVCEVLQVPYFACRGYTSQSEMWAAARRLKGYVKEGQEPIILHFGDHDPSGIDMTRDIEDRLRVFMGGVCLERLALNMEQVQEYQPPANPAKTTDARYAHYVRIFGVESWELDALEPALLAELVRNYVLGVRMERRWNQRVSQEELYKSQLLAVAQRWDDVQTFLD